MKTSTSAPPPALFSCDAGPLRVTYSDTDRMGHVYYAQYLVWLEIGRTDILRQLGSNYKSWEDDHGIFLPVRECAIKYRVAAQYDDLLIIRTHMTRLTKASVDFDYEISRAEDACLLATAHTTHAFVDATGAICRVAQTLLPRFF